MATLLTKISIFTLCLSLEAGLILAQNNTEKEIGDADIYSVAYLTVPTLEVGKTIGRGLLKNKLADSINIIPQVTTMYMWKDEVHEDNGLFLIIKTRTTEMDSVTQFVRSQHPYNMFCEVVSFPIKNDISPFLKWLGENPNLAQPDTPLDNRQLTLPKPVAMPSNKHSFVPQIPNSCQKSTFCEDIPDYPQEVINGLLAQEPLNLRVDQGSDDLHKDIGSRFGDPEETELCGLRAKVIYPQAVLSAVNGTWFTVINRKPNPVQGFYVEICDEDGSSCSDIVGMFNYGLSSRCKQKYVFRTAYVIDEREPKIIETYVKLPIGCSCVAYLKL